MAAFPGKQVRENPAGGRRKASVFLSEKYFARGGSAD